LSARYELRDDILHFEIVSATEVLRNKLEAVQDFEVNVVQLAKLKKN
jgi:hypothetical protein